MVVVTKSLDRRLTRENKGSTDRDSFPQRLLRADLETSRAAQSQEPLLGRAVRAGRPEHFAALEAGAVREGRRRRLLDLDQHVPPRLRLVLQLGNRDSPEQPEGAQLLLALDPFRVAERLTRLQRDLALDRRGLRPMIADDDDVIDDHLRTFGNRECHIGACIACGEHHARLDADRLVTAVPVFQLEAIAIVGDVHLRIRMAGGEGQHCAELIRAQRPVAGEVHGRHQRARPFGDVDRNLDMTIRSCRSCRSCLACRRRAGRSARRRRRQPGNTPTPDFIAARVKPRARYIPRMRATAESSVACTRTSPVLIRTTPASSVAGMDVLPLIVTRSTT